jgi:hypothetical protein
MAKVFVTRELTPRVMERLRAAPEIKELRVNPDDRVLTRAGTVCVLYIYRKI